MRQTYIQSIGGSRMTAHLTGKTATDFVTSYIDAWNRQDAEAIASHLAEQGTYVDIPDHQLLSRQEWIFHLREVFNDESYVYKLVGEVCSGKSVIAFQYEARPRAVAVGESIDPWYGAEFITIRSSAAVDITDYYEQPGSGTPGSPIANTTGTSKVQRYAKSGLSAAQTDTVKARISGLMAEKKLYLQPDLTLPQLASALSCSVNHVSQAINAGFGMSFFDYLNQLRVREATDLLQAGDGDTPTVLDVALQVGFNSTSTFYVAFKKATGKTPAEFRREARARGS